jgi:hypothetical protein
MKYLIANNVMNYVYQNTPTIIQHQPFCNNQCALHEFITLFNTNTFELDHTLSLSNTS